VITLTVKLKRMRPADVLASEFNAFVREAIVRALDWWIRERLKLRFGADASRRFGYTPRGRRWLIRKAIYRRDLSALKLLGKESGNWQFDAHPFEFTGELMKTVTAQANATATATASRQRGIIALPLGHEINPAVAGEHGIAGSVTEDEWRTMRKMVTDHVMQKLRTRPMFERLGVWP
jgi:hypothetical protein